jgi:hypothetical protein
MPLSIIEDIYPEKTSFRPSKWTWKLKLLKNSKLPKLSEHCFEPVGKGGWPPISIWIRDIPHTNEYTDPNNSLPHESMFLISTFDP